VYFGKSVALEDAGRWFERVYFIYSRKNRGVKKYGWIVASLTALAVYLLYAYFQPTYSYHLLDSRYDALKYAKAYDYFNDFAIDYQLSFPFNTRILMPWLAAQLPFNDLKMDFVWLNGLFIVLTVGVLTFVWQKLQIRLSLILLGLFWALFHWKGLVRMYLPDPLTADVGGYFWLTSSLTLLLVGEGDNVPIFNWNRLVKACFWILTAVLGTLQKESFIAVLGVTAFWGALSLWFVRTPTVARETQKDAFSMTKDTLLTLLSAFLIAVLAHYLVSFFFPASTSDWRNHSLISLSRGVKRYILQPELFLRLPISWLLAYGTLWLALLRSSSPSLLPHSHYSQRRLPLLTPHFCLWLLLSVFGGGDTTRILFNGMPFVLTFLLLKLNQQPKWVVWYLLFTSLPLMRLNELEPDLGLYPQATQRWCVECWTLRESWEYWVYAIAVLAGYYYFLRRFGTVSRDKTNHVNAGG
jgi:hypothetical protein